MNKKFLKKLISFSAAAACLLPFAGCASASSSAFLQADGTIYNDGVQIVTLTLSSDDDASFNEDISAADVTLTGLLEDKEIVEVYYVDETTLLLGLSGEVEGSADETSEIMIDASGISTDQEVSVAIQVDFEPYITVESNFYTDSDGIINASSQYVLPYGSFYEDYLNNENIQLVGEGELSYELNDEGCLRISVNNFTDDSSEDENGYPQVILSKDVTTFNTEIILYVGNDAPIEVVYEGNTEDDARLIVPSAPDSGRAIAHNVHP
jgi:hypothetical protein